MPSRQTHPVRRDLTLAQVLDLVDADLLAHFDWPDSRRNMNLTDPPVTFDALAEAVCLGESASEHPAYDVLDVWHVFHRDVHLLIGFHLGQVSAGAGTPLMFSDYQHVWRQVAEYHRGLLERRQEGLTRRPSPTPRDDQRNCDGWCVTSHENRDGGFHHDGVKTRVALGDSGSRDSAELVVRLSRWAADQQEEPGRCDPVMLDVDWVENAGGAGHTQFELDEAEAFARALLLKVADARHSLASVAGARSC